MAKLLVVLVPILCWLGFWGFIMWAVVHFILKYW